MKTMLTMLAAFFAPLQSLFNPRSTRLSNEEITATGFVGIPNEIALDSREWLKVPYGNFDHSKGLQIFDKSAAEAMANEFNAPLRRFIRWASAKSGGAPFYIGHPDDPSFANEYKDKRAHGWVKELRADEDGLAMRVEWTPLGNAVLDNQEYRFFSPRWDAVPVAGKTKQFRPHALISAGFTNQPNIPVNPISNEDAPMMLPDWLAEALGVPADADKDAVLAAIAAKVDGAKAVAAQTAEAAKMQAEAAMIEAKAEADEAKTELANERKERRVLIIANAVKEGKITAAQTGEWETKLTTDFANSLTALAALANTLPGTGKKTENLGARKSDGTLDPEKLATLANERANKTGQPFAICYAQIRAELQKNPGA